MNTDQKSTILVELDSILDTRLGTLSTIDASLVPPLLVQHGYHERMVDTFEGYDTQTFKERYKNRDAKVLSLSGITPMIDMASNFVKKTLDQTLQTPFHRNPKIELNIYPYTLTDAEVQLILGAVVTKTNKQCDVEVVSYSHEELNPVFVRQHYSMMMMYDYQLWLETHAKNGLWKKYSCPTVLLFCPLMIKNHELDIPEFKQRELLLEFGKIVEATRPYVDLHMLPVEAFSWVCNPHKENTSETQQESQK